MARPEFYAASVPVREAFIQHLGEHNNGLGILPEGMPPMEDAAELGMEEMGGMPPQGGEEILQ